VSLTFPSERAPQRCPFHLSAGYLHR